jgi:hypothetical protein
MTLLSPASRLSVDFASECLAACLAGGKIFSSRMSLGVYNSPRPQWDGRFAQNISMRGGFIRYSGDQKTGMPAT